MTEKLNDQGFTDKDLDDMASYIHGIAGKRAEHYASLLKTNRGLPEDGEARETMARMLEPFLPKVVQSLPTVQGWINETPVTGVSRNSKPGTIKFRP